MENRMLYSQITKISYDIANKYYKEFYVWCCEKPNYGPEQPASSNPILRCRQIMSDIITDDNHSSMIEENKNGIIKGASFKKKDGIITKSDEKDIMSKVRCAENKEFCPYLCVIPYDIVKDRLEAVEPQRKANSESNEYIIYDLKRDEFDLIEIDECADLNTILRRK